MTYHTATESADLLEENHINTHRENNVQ